MSGAGGPGEAVRIARCACGALSVTVCGEPNRINVCSCHQCQVRSGSAFTYTAFFTNDAATIAGDYRTWRGFSDGGRWQDQSFCPACGVSVFSYLESMPGSIGIKVGCFTDPAFAPPPKFYWTSRKHHWLTLPDAIEMLETQ